MKKAVACLTILALAVSFLSAGPFGLEFGWTRADMEKAGVELLKQKELGGGSVAYLVNPVQKLSTFSTYEVRVDSQLGIYYIGANGDLDAYSSVKDSFNSTARLLTRSYGSSKTGDTAGVDYLIPNSSENTLVWLPASKNGTDISTIILSQIRQGIGIYSTYLRLEYFSQNYDQVEAKLSSIL